MDFSFFPIKEFFHKFAIKIDSVFKSAKVSGSVINAGAVVVGDHNVVGNPAEEDFPQISFYINGPVSGMMFLELNNSGTEDVENVKITASWDQFDALSKQQKREERIIRQFLNSGDDVFRTRSFPNLNFLRMGERKIALEIPNKAIDKKVLVRVSCSGVKSKKKFEDEKIVLTASDCQKI